MCLQGFPVQVVFAGVVLPVEFDENAPVFGQGVIPADFDVRGPVVRREVVVSLVNGSQGDLLLVDFRELQVGGRVLAIRPVQNELEGGLFVAGSGKEVHPAVQVVYLHEAGGVNVFHLEGVEPGFGREVPREAVAFGLPVHSRKGEIGFFHG